MDLQKTTINGRQITALPFVLEALWKAHNDLTAQGIGTQGMLGLVIGEVITSSWRSEALQTQLFNQVPKVTWTMDSNHRHGTAVDVFPDTAYLNAIIPTMNKYNLVNDLAPVDADHFNWGSNAVANTFPLINEQLIITDFVFMDSFDNCVVQLAEPNVLNSGAFALVYGGELHLVSDARMAAAVMTAWMRGMKPMALTNAQWTSIPVGPNF